MCLMGLFIKDGLLELFLFSIVGQVYEKFLYSTIWLNPKKAVKVIHQIFGGEVDPCEAVHLGLVSAKVIQAAPMIYAWSYFGSVPKLNNLGNLMLVMVGAFGQYLNFSVYDAIGKDGVYYGIKFGKSIPWSHKFPYNYPWLKHPQYWGAYLFIIAAVLLAFSSIEYSYKLGYIVITGCIHCYISYVEQYL